MFDIQHMMEEGCSSGSCSYNGKEPTNNEACKKEQCPPSNSEACKKEACPPNNEACKKEACPPNNEACKKEGCKRESSVFEPMFQALDEFKGDAELQNSARNVHDKLSGDHQYSKEYKANKSMVRDMLSGRSEGEVQAKNMKEKRDIDNDKARSRILSKGMEASNRKDIAAVAGFKDESASIFESLFSQI